MKLSKLKYNPENPRRISPEQLDKLVKSIESLPKMMELRPIVYDPNTMYVLGGNQRHPDQPGTAGEGTGQRNAAQMRMAKMGRNGYDGH